MGGECITALLNYSVVVMEGQAMESETLVDFANSLAQRPSVVGPYKRGGRTGRCMDDMSDARRRRHRRLFRPVEERLKLSENELDERQPGLDEFVGRGGDSWLVLGNQI